MSKQVFDALPKAQQDIIMALGLKPKSSALKKRLPTTKRWPKSMPPKAPGLSTSMKILSTSGVQSARYGLERLRAEDSSIG